MNIYQFMSENPYLTGFLCLFICHTVFKIVNRIIRHFNLRKNGWPPAHCDADGDFKDNGDCDAQF